MSSAFQLSWNISRQYRHPDPAFFASPYITPTLPIALGLTRDSGSFLVDSTSCALRKVVDCSDWSCARDSERRRRSGRNEEEGFLEDQEWGASPPTASQGMSFGDPISLS